MLQNNTSLITVTYNSINVIKVFLSQKKLNLYSKIIVIDNNSSDDTVDFIEKKYPNILCIKNNKNIGYGNAVNHACGFVETEYVVITNPDTIFSDTFYDDLTNGINRYPDFSILSPSFFNFSSIDKFNGKFFSNNQILNRPKVDTKSILPGPCFLAKLSFFKRKKIWDSDIFLYFEDHDLVRRLNNKKNPIITLHDCYIFNVEGGSSEDSFKLLRLKNWHYGWSFFYFKKKYRESGKFYFLIINFKRVIISLITMNKKRFFISFYRLKGFIAFYRGLKAMDVRDIGPF